MCNLKTLNKTSNGLLLFCPKNEMYQLSFNNLTFNLNRMNGKKLTILLLLLGAFLLFLTVLFYLLKFGSANFSDNANDWVNFSNYFSGILNPIFTLLNLVF